MTVRDIYEATLIEINKENAQSFTIEEFNYIVNKAMLAFENEKYNFYALNQQLSDDLRVFIKNQTFIVEDTDPIEIDPDDYFESFYNTTTSYVIDGTTLDSAITLSTVRDLKVGDSIQFGENTDVYSISVITDPNIIEITEIDTTPPPSNAIDYNACIKVLTSNVIPDSNYTTTRTIKSTFIASDYLHLISCRTIWKTRSYKQNKIIGLTFPGKRLTYDMLNAIQNNTYLKPAPNRPYYQIFDNTHNSGSSVFPTLVSNYKGYQNKPLMELHIGNKNASMQLMQIEYDYLKIPEHIELHDEDIYIAGVDTSQVLELPDYLKNELVKKCTIYLLEKARDPRVGTQPNINQEMPTMPMAVQMDIANRTPPQQNPKA